MDREKAFVAVQTAVGRVMDVLPGKITEDSVISLMTEEQAIALTDALVSAGLVGQGGVTFHESMTVRQLLNLLRVD